MITITPWGGIFFGMGKSLQANMADQLDSEDLLIARQYSPHALTEYDGHLKEVVGFYKVDSDNSLQFHPIIPTHGREAEIQEGSNISSPYHLKPSSAPAAIEFTDTVDPHLTPHDGGAEFSPTQTSNSMTQAEAMHTNSNNMTPIGNSIDPVSIHSQFISPGPSGAQRPSFEPSIPLPPDFADMPSITTQDAVGRALSSIPLQVSAHANEQNGSENLQVLISNLQAGDRFNVGHSLGNGQWIVDAKELVNLQFMSPFSGERTLDFSVFSTDGDASAGMTHQLHIQITPQTLGVTSSAVAPALSAYFGLPSFGHGIPVLIAMRGQDPIADNLTLTISDVPEGGAFNHGVQIDSGTWLFTANQLTDLEYIPQEGFAGHTQFKLAAKTINSLGEVAVTHEILTGAIESGRPPMPPNTANGPPVLITSFSAGVADLGIPVNIQVYQQNFASVGAITVTIDLSNSNLPNGTLFSAGTNNGNGTWTLTPAQLHNLQISIPPDADNEPYNGYTLKVTASETFANGVTMQAPSIDLRIAVAETNNDLFAILQSNTAGAAPASSDLTVTLRNMPVDAYLVDANNNQLGEHLGNGVWEISGNDLENMRILVNTPGSYSIQVSATVTALQSDTVQFHGTSISSVNLPINTTIPYSFINTPLFLDGNGLVNFVIANGDTLQGGISFDFSSGGDDISGVSLITLNPLDHTPIVSIPTGVGALTGQTVDLHIQATARYNSPNQKMTVTLSGLPLDAIITPPTGLVATQTTSVDPKHASWIITGNSGTLDQVKFTTQTAGEWNIQVTTAVMDPQTRFVSFMSEITNVIDLRVFDSTNPESNSSLNFFNNQLGAAYTNALTAQHPSVVSPVMPNQFLNMAPETNNTPANVPSYTSNNALFLDLDHLTAGHSTTMSGDNSHQILVLSGTENFTLTAITEVLDGFTVHRHQILSINTATDGHFTNLQVSQPGQTKFTLTTSDNHTFQLTNISQIVWQAPPETPALPVAPVISTAELSGVENGAVNLDINIQIDPSIEPQDVMVIISGLTQGTLSSGHPDQQGNWHVSLTELPKLQLIPTPGFHGDMALSVTAQVQTEHGHSAISTNQVLVHVLNQAIAPTLSPTADASGVVSQGIPISLNVISQNPGFNASDNLQILISNMQPGDTFNYGAPSVDGQHWVIDWQEMLSAQWEGGASLQLLAPFAGHQHLLITAMSSQQGDNVYASITQSLHVEVLPAPGGNSLSEQLNLPAALNLPPQSSSALAPQISSDIGSAATNEPILLMFTATGIDPLRHDSITVTVRDLPEGGYFFTNHEDGSQRVVGAHIDAGTWVLPSDQLNRIYYQPPSGYAGNLILHFETQTINGLGDAAITSLHSSITIYPSEIPNPPPYTPVATAPLIVAANAVGLSSLAVPLNIQVFQHDYTRAGTISVNVSVPAGSYLSAGTQLNNQEWQLTADQLHGLQFYMPPTGDQVSTLAQLGITASETFADGSTVYHASTNLSVQLFDTAANLVKTLNPELSSQVVTTPMVDPSFFQNLTNPVMMPSTTSADLTHGFSLNLVSVEYGTVINGDAAHGNTIILHGDLPFTLVGSVHVTSGDGISSSDFLNINTAVQGKFSSIDVQQTGNTSYVLTSITGKKIFFNNISHIVLNPEAEINTNLPLPETPTLLTSPATGFENHSDRQDFTINLGHLVAADSSVDPVNVTVTVGHLNGAVLNIPNLTYVDPNTVQFRLSDVPADGVMLQPPSGFYGNLALTVTAQAMNNGGNSGIIRGILNAEVLPVTEAPTNFNPETHPDPVSPGIIISLDATSNDFLKYVISDLEPGDSFNVGYSDPENPAQWIVLSVSHLDPANPQIVYRSPFAGSHTFTIAAISQDPSGGTASIAKAVSVEMPSVNHIVGTQIQVASPADANHYTTALPPTLSFTAELQAADGSVNLDLNIIDRGPLQHNELAAIIYIHSENGNSGSLNYGIPMQANAWLLSAADLAALQGENAPPLQFRPEAGFMGSVNFEVTAKSTSILGDIAYSRDYTNTEIHIPSDALPTVASLPSPAILLPSVINGLWAQSVPLYITVLSDDYLNTTITISGLPQYAALSAGIQTLDGMGNASWTMPQTELANLRLAYPNLGIDNYPLSFQVSATEAGNTTSATLNLAFFTSVATLENPTQPVSLPTVFSANYIYNPPSAEPTPGYVLNLAQLPNQEIGAIDGTITLVGNESYTLTGWVTTTNGLSHQFLSVSSDDHLSKIDIHEPVGTTVYQLSVGGQVISFTNATHIQLPQPPAVPENPVRIVEPIAHDVHAIPGNNQINLGMLAHNSGNMVDPSTVAICINNLPSDYSLNLNPGAIVTLTEHSAQFHLSDIPALGLVLTVPPSAINSAIPLLVSMQTITDQGRSPSFTTQINANVLPIIDLPNISHKTAFGEASTALFPNIILLTDTTEIVFSHLQTGDSFSLGHPDPDVSGQWIIDDPEEIRNFSSITYNSPFAGDHAIEVTTVRANSFAYASISEPHHIILTSPAATVASQLGTASTILPPQITASVSTGDLGSSLNLSILDPGPLQFNNLKIQISVTHNGDIPDLGRLSAGIEVSPGTWILNANELSDLHYQHAQSGTLNFQINVQATSVFGEIAQQQISLISTVSDGIGDTAKSIMPLFFTPPATIISGLGSALPIEYFPVNAADTSTITLSGLPADMLLSHGHNNGGGTWTLSTSDLPHLEIFTPTPIAQTIQITATANEIGFPTIAHTFELSVVPTILSMQGMPITVGSDWQNHAFIVANAPASPPSNGFSFDLNQVGSYPNPALDVQGNHTLILTGDKNFTLVGSVLSQDGARQFMSVSSNDHPSKINVEQPAGDIIYTLTVDGRSITINHVEHFVFPQFEPHVSPPIPVIMPNISASNETILVGTTDINIGNLVSVDPSVDPSNVLITLSQIPNGTTLQLSTLVTVTTGSIQFRLSEVAPGGILLKLPHPATADAIIPLTVAAETLNAAGESSGVIQSTINLIPAMMNGVATAVLDNQPPLSTIALQPVTLTSDSDISAVFGATSAYTVTIYNLREGDYLNVGHADPAHPGQWVVSGAELQNVHQLQFLSPFAGTRKLELSAVLVDPTNTDAVFSENLVIDIAPRSLGVPANVGVFDLAIPLATSKPASATLLYQINLTSADHALPAGSILSAGINNHDGTWTLTEAQLKNLQVSIPNQNLDRPYQDYQFKIQALDANNHLTGVANTNAVTVYQNAEHMSLAVNQNGILDKHQPYLPPSLLYDGSGQVISQQLSISISGLPAGAVPTLAGVPLTHSGDQWNSGLVADLHHLQISFPNAGNFQYQVVVTYSEKSDTMFMGFGQLFADHTFGVKTGANSSQTLTVNTSVDAQHLTVIDSLYVNHSGIVTGSGVTSTPLVPPPLVTFTGSYGDTFNDNASHFPGGGIPLNIDIETTGHEATARVYFRSAMNVYDEISDYKITYNDAQGISHSIASNDFIPLSEFQHATNVAIHGLQTMSGQVSSQVLLHAEVFNSETANASYTSFELPIYLYNSNSGISGAVNYNMFVDGVRSILQSDSGAPAQFTSEISSALFGGSGAVPTTPSIPAGFIQNLSAAPSDSTANVPFSEPSHQFSQSLYHPGGIDHDNAIAIMAPDSTHDVLVLSGDTFSLQGYHYTTDANGNMVNQADPFININTAQQNIHSLDLSNLSHDPNVHTHYELTTSHQEKYYFDDINHIINNG